jgi:hypothetical protein
VSEDQQKDEKLLEKKGEVLELRNVGGLDPYKG